MKLQDFLETTQVYSFIDIAKDKDLARQIQTRLISLGLLKPPVDGIFGPLSSSALERFQGLMEINEGKYLGTLTAEKLIEAKPEQLKLFTGIVSACKRQNTERQDRKATEPPNPTKNLGTRTGKTMSLPSGILVYENELITSNIPLTWGEATKGCTRIPTEKWEIENAIKLAKVFGEVRAKFGSPIRISSGYRPRAVNQAIGGASHSQHILFKALDMIPVNGDFGKFWEVLKDSSFTGLGDGFSSGKDFYHGDIRDGNRLIFGY